MTARASNGEVITTSAVYDNAATGNHSALASSRRRVLIRQFLIYGDMG